MVASFFPGLLLWFWAGDRHLWLARQGKKSVGLQLLVLLGFILTVPLFKFSEAAPHKTSSGLQFSNQFKEAFASHPVGIWFFMFGIAGFGIVFGIWIITTGLWTQQAMTGHNPQSETPE
jgi:hypothetical protein